MYPTGIQRALRPRSSLPSRFSPKRCTVWRSASTRPAQLNLQAIDKKWQKRWQDAMATKEKYQENTRSKAYVLSMFPYPSGALHMGHLRVYTIADVLARFLRMQGRVVLNPMGWDAFGLPAENAAIERGIDPAEWTTQNISRMKEQLVAMNGGFDWNREFMTCDPAFYKHTQRIFLLLHEKGLAYQAKSLVNFDPIDKTVLANEQVDANGCSWRSGAKVEKLDLKQWFLRVTEFKEALLEDLDILGEDGSWPERVIAMQRNWLGKSAGAKIKFPITLASDMSFEDLPSSVNVFTTRPDTLCGVQYIALSLAHPIVACLAKTDPDLRAFLADAPSLPAESKAGFLLTGISATNPMTLISTHLPSLNRQLPVYVAPYVLRDYGEGAVMGVPGHDARDYKFWRQHQPDAQVLQVIAPDNDEAQGKAIDGPYTGYGVLTKSCGDLAGMKSHLASKKIISDLQSLDGSLAEPAHVWKLRDWLISRQRYWGTPIPIIHCNSCGAVPVPLEKLPVELPKLHRTQFSRSGGNPLESAVDWVNTSCPKCGGPAKRETDTMDTFVDSSWYFMRYVDPYNNNLPFSKEKSDMLPVDIYIGGIEHAILHLLYARFMSKFLATTSLWPSGRDPAIRGEPFRKLISQGMVHGKTFSDPCTGRFLKPDEVDMSNPSSPRLLATGETPTISFEKMSKSKHNGVDPARCITQYGADVTRAHILFQAPVAEVLEWDESRIFGIQRWFGRVYRLAADLGPKLPASLDTPRPKEFTAKEMELWHLLQQTIEALTLAFGKTHTLNTAISDLMTLSNAIISLPSPSPLLRFHTTSALLRMLAPIAPAFAEECWEALYCGRQAAIPSILQAPWPVPVEVDVVMQPCAVTENGKLRFVVDIPVVPQESSQKEAEEWVLGEVGRTEVGRNWLAERKEWKRVVVVKGGRTVNFVR